MTGGRVLALDGIRGVACLIVIGLHTSLPQLKGGWLGVDAFFVLSGYLITGLLIDERERSGRINLKEFWVRRAARLVPAILVTVLICIGLRLTGVLHPDSATWKALAMALTSTANLTTKDLGALKPTWSLAVEEQFYLLWPLLLMLALRSRRSILIICASFGTLSFSCTLFWFTGAFGTLPHTWELLAGSALASAWPKIAHRAPRGTALVGLMVAAAAFAGGFSTIRGRDDAAWPMLGMTLATMLIILGCQRRDPAVWLLSLRPLRYVGKLSYGLYLLHMPVLHALSDSTSLSRSTIGGVTVVVTLGLAAAMFRWIEAPIRSLCRRRIPPRVSVTFDIRAVERVNIAQISGFSSRTKS